MNPIIHELTLDLRQPGTRQVIYAKQDDSMRAARLTLYDGGTIYNVPSEATLQIAYCKRDRKGGLYDKMPDNSKACTFSGNVVTAQLHPQMFTVAGLVVCELRVVTANGDQLSTFSWTLQVEPSATAHMESQDYFNTGGLRETVEELKKSIGDLNNLQTAVKTNLVAAINYLRQTAVFRVNNILPDQEHGNVTLKPKDISVEIPGTSFNNTLQVLLNALYAGAEQNVTEQYERWSSSGGSGGVLDFFLSEAIADPGCYVVYTRGKTWRMRYIVARTDSESTDWRWVESYSEDGFFMLSLYAGQDKVLVIDPDSGGYRIYDDEFALKSDAERDVTKEYAAWRVTAPSGENSVRHFLKTLPDGTYRLTTPEGDAWRMSRVTTQHGSVLQQLGSTDGEFFYSDVYVDDAHIWEQSSEEGTFAMNGRQYALTEYVDKCFAAANGAAYTEIEKLRPNQKSDLRSIRIYLNGLTPMDDGHLRLALWRCDRKYARHKWVPARKVSDIEDHSVGYSRIRGKYGSSGTSGPDYPSTPAWMPNSGLAESFYSIYAEDGSLLPYVDIPLDSFVLPLVKPVGVLPDKSGWSGDPWDTCGVVGTDKTGGFLRFRFDVEKEDGTVLARCRNTLKVGAKNVLLQTPSAGLLKAAEPGSSSRRADLKNWYIRVE